MLSFRMRFRAYETSHGFEEMLELTCPDEHLPKESKSRGGRLLSNEGTRPDLFKVWLEMCHSKHGEKCGGTLPPDILSEVAGSFTVSSV